MGRKSEIVSLDWVRDLSHLDDTRKTPLWIYESSSLAGIFFGGGGHFLTPGIQTLKFSGTLKLCPAVTIFVNETLL